MERFIDKYSKRDASVELLRLLACFLVIASHVNLEARNAVGQLSTGRLFITSLVDQAVAIFFFIVGFFLYNGKNLKKTAKKVAISIVIPFVMYLLLEPVFLSYCLGEKSFLGCLRDMTVSEKNLFQVFCWTSNYISYGAHLWYVFVYLEVMLFLPLVQYLCKDNARAVKFRRYFIALGLISKLLEDVQKIVHGNLGIIQLFNPLGMPIVITLIGYELYQKRDKFHNWKCRWGGLGIYFVLNVISVIWTKLGDYKGVTTRLLAYDSVIKIVAAAGFSVFILSFTIKHEKIKAGINFVASQTYYIYLIHMLVVTKLYTAGIRGIIEKITVAGIPGFIGEFLFTVLFAAAVFAGSFICTLIIKGICCIVKWIYAGIYKTGMILAQKAAQQKDYKSSILRWLLRGGLILVVLGIELAIYRYCYIDEVVRNSRRGRVLEQCLYTEDEVDKVSAAHIVQEMTFKSVKQLCGIGTKIFLEENADQNAVLGMKLTEKDSGRVWIEEEISVSSLNDGDLWRCFFNENFQGTFEGIVELTVQGDTQGIGFYCLSGQENLPKMIVDGKETDTVLFLVSTEPMDFVKEVSDIYCVACVVLTLVIIGGIFVEQDRKQLQNAKF